MTSPHAASGRAAPQVASVVAVSPLPGAPVASTHESLNRALSSLTRAQKQAVEVASYDDRMAAAARKMGFAIARSDG